MSEEESLQEEGVEGEGPATATTASGGDSEEGSPHHMEEMNLPTASQQTPQPQRQVPVGLNLSITAIGAQGLCSFTRCGTCGQVAAAVSLHCNCFFIVEMLHARCVLTLPPPQGSFPQPFPAAVHGVHTSGSDGYASLP